MAQTSTNTRSDFRTVERLVGAGLILYLIGVTIQVLTRVASNFDQDDFTASLNILARDPAMFRNSMYASLISNALLVGLAAGLCAVFRRHQPGLAQVAAFLLLATAVVSLLSASAGLALASLTRDLAAMPGGQATNLVSSAGAVEAIRESAGRTGFTLNALSLLTFGVLIAWKQPLPKWLGWLGILIGFMMLFIWYESAPFLHRMGGSGFLLWLAVTGGWLLLRGTIAPATSPPDSGRGPTINTG